jgi:hypothetical protein
MILHIASVALLINKALFIEGFSFIDLINDEHTLGISGSSLIES